jgi:amino acid adenylation domain-containing protein
MAGEHSELLDEHLISGEPSGTPLMPIHKRFERVVAEGPERVAVVVDGKELTYGELNAQSNRLARELLKHTGGARRNIGILVSRSANLIVTKLAVLKAGSVCVPLATEYSTPKLAFIVENSQATLVLTTSQHQRELPNVATLALDGVAADLSAHASTDLDIPCQPDDLAYILHTSGTTGNPKGVMLQHGGIDNNLSWRRDFYGVSPADVFLHKSPIGFDVSIWEIFLPLTTGARVVLAPPGSQALLPAIINIIIKHQVTVLQFVASLFREFLEFKAVSRCTSLRLIKCGGEAWSFDLVRRCLEKLPTIQLANGYGPTEASVGISGWKCDPNYEYGCLVIGRPVYDSYFLVLDEEHRPVGIGECGELYVGGAAVSPGYWNNERLTAEKFVTLPSRKHGRTKWYRTGDIVKILPDHNLTYQGRRDNQIKVNGLRIELEEIEEVVGSYEGVRQAAIVCHERPPGEKVLHAFLVADQMPDTASLVRFCTERLAAGVVPKTWTVVDTLPLTQNGKLNRDELLRRCM